MYFICELLWNVVFHNTYFSVQHTPPAKIMAAAGDSRVLYVTVPRARLKEFNNKYLNLAETFYCVSFIEKPAASDADPVRFMVNFKYAPDEQQSVEDVVASIQNYVEWSLGSSQAAAAAECGEDSSYDSDHDPDDGGHRAASRTPSDTLAAEFAEHVTIAKPNNAKIQYALRLGYSEQIALQALQKLGPDPSHNDLMAELTRLTETPRPDTPPEAAEGVESQLRHAKLRHIVIDGSNVAMSHGNKEVFSSRGIEICVEWFRVRGHNEITVFVPKWRKEFRPDNPVTDRDVLDKLERERVLVYTPSRLTCGKRLVCYDDRYVLRLAADVDGIVVSNDNYHDLAGENADFRRIIEERILMYTFVNDRFMPPDDPLGRTGPTLEMFLSTRELPPLCPYDRKCTYGNKCKYYHPDRTGRNKFTAERLSERAARVLRYRHLHTLSLPPAPAQPPQYDQSKRPLARAHSATPRLPDATLASHFDRAQLQLPHRPQPQQDTNTHRKLARQLTLNPSCDPRLAPTPVHAAAARVASAPAGAAPAAEVPWFPVPWPVGSSAAYASESALPIWETRRRMHYHLSGIFPAAQVAEAMAAYPDEMDAQNMCAIILARYRSELPRMPLHPGYCRR